MTGVAVSPVSPIIPYFPKSDGTPASGYRVFTYAAGTTTKLTTYTDSTGTVPQTNPIVLNSKGYPEGTGGASVDIWLQSGVGYKLVYAFPGTDDPPTNTVWTNDNVSAGGGGGGGGGGSATVISGSGVPTTVAPQGSLYQQTNGGVNTSLWQSLGTATGNLQITQLADTALHLYPLAETSGTAAQDVVASGASNGTYSGAYTLADTPLSSDQSGAVLFSGGKVALSYMDVPGAPTSFSVECLCSPTNEEGGVLVCNDTPTTTNKGFLLKATETNGFQLNMGFSAANTVSIASPVYPGFVGATFHVVFTFDAVNQVVSLYVNGVLVNTSGATGTYHLGENNIQFGKSTAGTNAFTGEMQLVGIYASVLTQQKITNHYKAIQRAGNALWFLVGGGGGVGAAGGGSSPASGVSPLQTADFTISSLYSTWRCDTTAGSITITGNPSPTDGETYTILDVTGQAATHAIKFTGTINGTAYSASNLITVAYGDMTIQWNALLGTPQYNQVP